MEAMPKHKQAGQTTVLTKMTANITRKHLQCRSHPQRPFVTMANAAAQLPQDRRLYNGLVAEFEKKLFDTLSCLSAQVLNKASLSEL